MGEGLRGSPTTQQADTREDTRQRHLSEAQGRAPLVWCALEPRAQNIWAWRDCSRQCRGRGEGERATGAPLSSSLGLDALLRKST